MIVLLLFPEIALFFRDFSECKVLKFLQMGMLEKGKKNKKPKASLVTLTGVVSHILSSWNFMQVKIISYWMVKPNSILKSASVKSFYLQQGCCWSI